jgi:predicted phage-related endonuclease
MKTDDGYAMPKSAPWSTRRDFIGGSDARIIMGNEEAALLRLWREKRGEAKPEDLTGNLLVQLGNATEARTGIGTSATPARWSQRSSGGSSIQ